MKRGIDRNSMNITEKNIEKLLELFPECGADGKIDFERLKMCLGEWAEEEREQYNFSWNGKPRALKISQTPSSATLRPKPEKSRDWEETENLFIEGDNLEVLKLLQKSYFGKIKLIYIDPPYNTGKDFVYADDFKDSISHYKQITGQLDQEGNRLSSNQEISGRYHTDWLNMMYPRLRLARNLLSPDGLILVNMDEHEITNLQKLLAEIFGETNDLGTIVWDKRNPKGDARGISYQHEYICVYGKNKERFLEEHSVTRPKKNAQALINKGKQLFRETEKGRSLAEINQEFSKWVNGRSNLSGGERAYCKIDENGDVYRAVSMAWPNKKKAPDDYFIPLVHPVTQKNCPVPERGWRNSSATMQGLLKQGLILFGRDESIQPTRKYLLKDNMTENIPSLLYYGGSDVELLKEMGIPFDTPKAVDVIREHIAAFTSGEDIILDFFAGSAATAHGVMLQNAEDGGKRRFIMVQLPEPCDQKSEAAGQGFRNICEIGEKRIRCAGDRIAKAELPFPDIDKGFRVFALDSSNMRSWQPDADNLETSLLSYSGSIVSGRSEMDIVYEIMLKMGMDLSALVLPPGPGKPPVYLVDGGALMICLAERIEPETVDYMIRRKQEISPGYWRVVCRDNGFADDNSKINMIEQLKHAGLDADALLTI